MADIISVTDREPTRSLPETKKMSANTEDNKERGGSVMIEWPAPIYKRLQDEARELTEREGRRVTVTELVRRRALSREMPSAA